LGKVALVKKRIVLLGALEPRCSVLLWLSVGWPRPPKAVIRPTPSAGLRAEAVRTLQPGFKPSDYNFHGGTGGDDLDTFTATAGPDVFCGFGGDDDIGYSVNLDEGDIFFGGAGNDRVTNTNNGTFFGEAGNDRVGLNVPGGTFNGGEGNDSVTVNEGTISNVEQVG
jgi:Ca2+-binding RTX toxin-like protein